MKIIVSTHQGNLYNEEVDYLVVHSNTDGDFGIMQNHVPVVSVMEEGYIKLVRDDIELYIVVLSGILEFSNNVATILVQEAHIGQNIESALEHLNAIRKEKLERNRKEGSDFTKKEKELRDHLKNSGAGSL